MSTAGGLGQKLCPRQRNAGQVLDCGCVRRGGGLRITVAGDSEREVDRGQVAPRQSGRNTVRDAPGRVGALCR